MVTGTVKEIYLSGPTLARLDPPRNFYTNKYWSKYGMKAVFLQADDSVELRKSKEQEKDGGKGEF